MKPTTRPESEVPEVTAPTRRALRTGTGTTLRDGVYRAVSPDGALRLFAWPRTIEIGVAGGVEDAVLRRLTERTWSRSELGAVNPASPAARLLDRLDADGWLATTAFLDDRPLYTVHPMQPAPAAEQTPLGEVVLSRFALLRRPDRGAGQPAAVNVLAVLESPLAWCELRMHDPRVAAVVTALAGGVEPEVDLPADVVDRLTADLRRGGFTTTASEDSGEAAEMRTRQWSLHELWFHQRSRLGGHGYLGDRFGGTFWARGTFDPPPARPRSYPGRVVPLYRPDPAVLRTTDPTLTAALEERESIRDQDEDSPITAEQLGELLYRTCRTRLVRTTDGFEYMSRPYPSGGSAYELEVYPLIRLAAGVEPGLYHYDSHEHALVGVRSLSHPAVRRLLRVAGHSTVVWRPPQVLLLLTARVGRVMWKYEAMAYALVLKHVGVLYQTVNLAATAMGLAGCGLGSGDPGALAEALGRDALDECGVGEFAIGSRHRNVPVWELGR